MSSPLVLTETRDKILTLTLHDPATRNAFSLEMAQQLLRAVRKADKDPNIRCIILTGTDPAFSSGGNIKQMAAIKMGKRGRFFLKISEIIYAIVKIFRQTHKIVIAAINGPVSGIAFGLVLSTDIRFASTPATFHAGTTLLGLAPNGSATYFLPRLVGMTRAIEILLTGRKIPAKEAQAIGLIHQAFPHEKFLNETLSFAQKMAQGAPLAQTKIKELLLNSWNQNLKKQLEGERRAIAWTSETRDFDEGISAFLDKRPPCFRGF